LGRDDSPSIAGYTLIHDMTSTEQAPEQSTFRSTLIRVMAVQVGALVVLWLLQTRYSG
jgi:hypothetical protein